MTQIVDSYDLNGGIYYYTVSGNDERAQSFTAGTGNRLANVKLYLRRIGSHSGNVYVKIYTHSGAYGTNSVGSGDAIAISDPINFNSIGTSYHWQRFMFTGDNRIKLTDDYYVLSIIDPDGYFRNSIVLGIDKSVLTHSGNYCGYYDGTWRSDDGLDIYFSVYEVSKSNKLPLHINT